jgi:hypothetical protein
MRRALVLITLLSLAIVAKVTATDFGSSSFIVRDPVVTVSGGVATSSNFQLISGSGQVVIGESTSTNFIGRAGFFYFPLITSPVLSATGGTTQVSLSWTSANASLGYVVSAYQVGYSTVSGGPYTYASAGASTSYTVTSLTAGTPYYFIVRVSDNSHFISLEKLCDVFNCFSICSTSLVSSMFRR